MDARSWLEQFRRALARHELPPLYAERLLSELSDHVTDFLEDPMSTDAKDLRTVARHFGSPRDVAARAANEYHQRHFCGRHPVVAFVLLPIASMPLLWTTALFAVMVAAQLLGFESGRQVAGPLADWAHWSLPGIAHAAALMPVAISAAFFCWLAARSAVHRKWTLIACSLVAVLGGLAVVQMTLPGGTHPGTVTFGLGVGARPSLAQLVQLAAPLAIGGVAIWRQMSRERRAWVR